MLRFLESVRQSFLREVMRVIKSDTGFLFYEKIFKQLMADQSDLVLWQLSPVDGKREISKSRINAFHMESGKIFFEMDPNANVKGDLPIYCFAEDSQIIFKATIDNILDTNLSVIMPEEIKVLEDPEVTLIQGKTGTDYSTVWKSKRLKSMPVDTGPDIMRVKSMAQRSTRDQELLNNEFGLTLDEEDKLFADKRESPRARPKADKWVKIALPQIEGPTIYKLFDLSQGGMAFVGFDETEFEKGDDVKIVGFNDFDLDDPLIGKIMSIRPIDGVESEFKFGVKFSEGQD